MQNKLIIALTAATLLGHAPVFAQDNKAREETVDKNETMVIHHNGPRTVIEIRDGKVFVDGNPVTTIKDTEGGIVHKKIIVENGNADADGRGEGFQLRGGDNMGNEGSPIRHRRAMLGVLLDDGSSEPGALVEDVTPGSAAEQAGLKEGDRIVRMDGKAIADARALTVEISAHHEVGDKVTIEYERDGKTENTSATLTASAMMVRRRPMRMNRYDNAYGEDERGFGSDGRQFDMQLNNRENRERFNQRPEMQNPEQKEMQEEKEAPEMNAPAEEDRPKIGISVEDHPSGRGVTVVSVVPESIAAKAGVRMGDVLLQLGNDPIETAAGLEDTIARIIHGSELRLKILRAGKPMTMRIMLPRAESRRDL